jgi:arylsulfatase A-like enzyme
VNIPICCPSRSTILSGLYPHNSGVVNNSISGGCSSPTWQENHEVSSIAATLKSAKGYKTFYAGKYLNQVKENKQIKMIRMLFVVWGKGCRWSGTRPQGVRLVVGAQRQFQILQLHAFGQRNRPLLPKRLPH